MDKFSIDFSQMEKNLVQDKKYKWNDIKHKPHIKVAFDVVRFTDSNDNIDGLWQIKHSDDGDYIVAMYDDNETGANNKKSSWTVLLDKQAEHVNIFYKNTPITKIAANSLNIPSDEVSYVCGYLPDSLEKNKKLASSLLSGLSIENKQRIKKAHPELSDHIKWAEDVDYRGTGLTGGVNFSITQT